MTWFYLFISFIASALTSMLLMPWILYLCKRNGYYDSPDYRKVHKNPVPRLGGVAFLPSAIIGVSASLYTLFNAEQASIRINVSTLVMTAGAFLIYFIGFFDDRFGMKAIHKFIIQIGTALFLPLCGLIITDMNGILGIHEIPLWAGYILTVFLILIIVNAINLIDGIDGLASGLCIFILSVYTYVFSKFNFDLIASLNAAIVGSLVVFWCFNMFGKTGHNKIFMGDAGSLFLGYVCAYMSIKSTMHPIAPTDCGEEQMLISVTLFFIPVMDVIRVAIQRLILGHGIFQPDKTHIHHLFMEAGISMHNTLACICVVYGLICGINYALWQTHLTLPLILLTDALIYILIITLIQHIGRKNKK